MKSKYASGSLKVSQDESASLRVSQRATDVLVYDFQCLIESQGISGSLQVSQSVQGALGCTIVF
jgi:hypothetical protein